jgi:hypothetical protein
MNEFDSMRLDDIEAAIQRIDADARTRAITSLDANPDDGARALQLSRATGVSPAIIYGDLPGFEQEHRSALAAGIVRGNDRLAAYIRGNPLADVVSNDDYGNLDTFSRKAEGIWELYKFLNPTRAFVEGTVDAAKGALTEAIPEREAAITENNPLARVGLAAIHAPMQLLGLVSAPIGGAQEVVRRAGQVTGNESEGEQLARDIGGIFESEMGRMGEQPAHPAKPWVDAGREPPRGIHPEIDRAKAEINAAVLEKLDENLAEAQASFTRERDQELFAEFARQHYETSSLAISGDRVLELYGDRVPSPDDGLLGWVPDLEQKLEAARATGEDVHIPLADWMTRVDPALARELHDDIRVWPGGITAREAAEPIEPRVVVDSPLAQARDASGTEPMFGIGDRKLELKSAPKFFEGMDEFQFHDQDGKLVGELTVIPEPETKTLYVANINGLAGLYSNSFGPSLVRDLKRQLKTFYPEYEFVTGHRVSGAREKAGVVSSEYDTGPKLDHPVVKLALDETAESLQGFHDLLEAKAYEHFGQGVHAELLPTEELSRFQREVGNVVREEISRIAGRGVEPNVVGEIKYGNLPGNISGAYLGELDTPRILVDLFSDDPIGYGRHEAIHHLYRAGLFTSEEWSALTKAAKAEGWAERYGIDRRYADWPEAVRVEESIAEAFRDWAANKDELPQPTTLVTQAFAKIQELWDRIKARLKEIFGRDLSPEELFTRALSGEVGAREGAVEGRGPAFALEDAKAKLDNLRAEAAGLDAKSFEKIQKLIQKRFEEDLAASMKRAERDQKRTQTKEWKERSAELEKEVEATIRQRPDVMADLLVGSGELAGKKLKQRFPLRADDLTAEQKAGLPRHYYSADGLPIDAAANLVGYTSGEEMVARLVEYNRTRGDLTTQEHLRRVIAEETERQMQARYGDLQKNIMLDAEDQALSETNLNILAEEWQGAAMSAGIATVDKDVAKAEALRVFGQQKLGDVDTSQLMAQMLKHYRDATRDLIAGNPADAVVRLQRRYMVGLMAAEAKKLEKQRAAFDRTAKQFSKREVPSVEPEYTNFIHDILMRVGKPVRRSIQDLAKQIEAGESKSLEDFVAAKTAALREVPVWDQLFDPTWRRKLEDLSVDEFRAVNDSIKALVWNGRDERKIYRQGEAADLAEVKKALIENVADSVGREVRPPKKSNILKTYYVNHLQMENIFNRWDAFNAKGAWNQYVMRDLVDGANQVDAWKKEYAKKIKELPVPEGLTKAVDNPIFKDQDTGTTIPFTRKNLIAVMLNTGTGTGPKSNLHKLAKGYGLEIDEVMAWVHQHATAEDWKFVQGVWDVFKDIKVKADTMYRSLSGGVAPEDVPVRPIATPHGEVKGGYYPVIFHPEMEGKSKKLMGRDPLEQEGFFRAATPAGYTKSRTGYVAPLALDMDQIPGRISQMLHDIGLRPAVLNAAKVFYDHDVRSAIRKYYGNEYKDQLVPYLRAVANASNEMTKSQVAFTRLSEFIRQNIITTLVGLNPGTVMKHGPSALVTSIREVGPGDFAKSFGKTVPGSFVKWVGALFRINEETANDAWRFAIENSLELQRRDRNWEESLYGTSGILNPGDKFTPWRQKIMQWASKPVALSDMISAVPTWLAAYEKEMAESGVHGDAVYAADRAVRRAHGSTAITSRTTIMRESSPWLTSVYNFFSDIMNRQMETLWKAGEAVDLAKEKEFKAAMATVPALTASLFAYAVWPAIVEHLVSGEGDEKDSWAKTAALAMTRTAASSWVGVRDAMNWLLLGYDPQFGLAGTAMKELLSVYKDLGKDHPFRKDHAGKLIQDGAAFVGATTGLVPAQIGRVGRYVHDVNVGLEHPRGPWAWLTGLRFGTTKDHSTTFERYMKGVRR